MPSATAEAARERRRTELYAGRPRWARQGRFSARLKADRALGPWGPCVCGICGYGSGPDEVLDPEAKADHLRQEHRAIVFAVTSSRGEVMYEWRV